MLPLVVQGASLTEGETCWTNMSCHQSVVVTIIIAITIISSNSIVYCNAHNKYIYIYIAIRAAQSLMILYIMRVYFQTQYRCQLFPSGFLIVQMEVT